MKKKILPIAIVLSVILINTADAQVRVNLNVNIGQRPAWGLPGNYAGDFYYFPEIDVYYNIPQHRFVYFDRGRWIYVYDLPRAYRGFDLYRGQKIVINDPNPFARPHYYRERYGRQYMAYRQPVVMVDKRRGYHHDDDDDDDRWERRDDDRRNRDRGRGRW
ncbi:MAG: hypothetical protein ACOYVG_15105 [Bacteroidota bacterium]